MGKQEKDGPSRRKEDTKAWHHFDAGGCGVCVCGVAAMVSQGGLCGGRPGGSEMRPAGSRLSGPGGGAKECGVYLGGHKGATEGLSAGP